MIQGLTLKRLLIIAIPIIGTAIAVFFIITFSRSQQESEWKTFRNERYYYEIKYPAHWILDQIPKDGYDVIYFYDPERNQSAAESDKKMRGDNGFVSIDFFCSEGRCGDKDGEVNYFYKIEISLLVNPNLAPNRIKEYKRIYGQMLSTFKFLY